MSEPGSYGDYLARMSAQTERDRDRFNGTDMHLNEPIFDPANGDLIHKPRAVFFAELDEEGLPVIHKASGTWDELWALSRAAQNHASHVEFGGVDARSMEQHVQQMRAEQARKHAEYIAERPFTCDRCRYGRFKTERGLAMHLRKCRVR